ncbi:MAG: FkbM family methyltransferase, partial [Chryseobacterium sp.]
MHVLNFWKNGESQFSLQSTCYIPTSRKTGILKAANSPLLNPQDKMDKLKQNIDDILVAINGLTISDKKRIIEDLEIQISAIEEAQSRFDGLKSKFQSDLTEAKIIKTAVGPYSKFIVTDTEQGKFAVDVEDMEVGKKLRADGEYQPEELVLLEHFIDNTSEVLIVGAHIGAFVVPLARKVRLITAIEANPASFALLNLNLHLNEIKNCRTFNLAAGEKSEKICFLQNRVNTGGSKRKPIRSDYMY